jgi:hypothetical protein
MARPRKVIDELAAQIQNLPRAEQVSVLDRILTPHLELEVALKRWHARTRRHDAREMSLREPGGQRGPAWTSLPTPSLTPTWSFAGC